MIVAGVSAGGALTASVGARNLDICANPRYGGCAVGKGECDTFKSVVGLKHRLACQFEAFSARGLFQGQSAGGNVEISVVGLCVERSERLIIFHRDNGREIGLTGLLVEISMHGPALSAPAAATSPKNS